MRRETESAKRIAESAISQSDVQFGPKRKVIYYFLDGLMLMILCA
jgi:hypothetical protein